MSQTAITGWLKRKRVHGMRFAAGYASATLFGGVFVLALTFSFIFVAAKVVLLSGFPLSRLVTPACALFATVVTGLIFADSIRARRDDLSFLPTWLLREYISIGPRLILEGWPYVLRVRRFSRMDVETCANVLAYLAVQNVPTSRYELLRRFPGMDWPKLSDDLRLLERVIFFRPDGVRVVLTMPLRLELRALLARDKPADIPKPEREPVPVETPHTLSPAEILGVPPDATLAQIKAAYRTRIKECHPDHFAGMDERSQALAEEWTKSLNAAYEILIAQARG